MTRMGFEAPCAEEPVAAAESECEVPEAGGMYIAKGGRSTVAVIVPPVVRNLTDLRCAPRVDGRIRSPEGLSQLLGIVRLWGEARLTGDFFAVSRQREVLRALSQHLFELICGENWARAEATWRDEPHGTTRLQEAVSRRRDEAAVGEILAREVADLVGHGCEERVQLLAKVATRFHLLPSGLPEAQVTVEWLSEFALRLASDPVNLEAWASERCREGLNRLLEAPVLARAARLLVLLTDAHLKRRVAPGELYASWGWT